MSAPPLPPLQSFQVGAIGLAVGIVAGLIVGYLIARVRFLAFNVMGKRIAGKDAVALVFDVENNNVDLVGLNRIGVNTFTSADPYTPLILFKATDAVPIRLKFIRKPVYVAFASSVFGLMVNPDLLGKLGVAGLVLGDKMGRVKEPTVYAMEESLLKLLDLEGEYLGYVDINPDLKLGVTIKVPEIATSIMSLAATDATSAVYGVLDQLQQADKFQRVVEMYRKAKVRGESRIFVWIMIVILVVSVVLILLRQFGIM